MMLIKQILPIYDDQQMMIQHEYTPFYTDQNPGPKLITQGMNSVPIHPMESPMVYLEIRYQ